MRAATNPAITKPMRGGRFLHRAAPCLCLLLAACAAEPPLPPPEPWRDLPTAGARSSAGGVLHVDRLGILRQRLEPGASFFPLVLDTAMVDYSRSVRFGFQHAAEAGFNAVAPWSDQPRAPVLNAAAGSRLLAILGEEASRTPLDPEPDEDASAAFPRHRVHIVNLDPFDAGKPTNISGTSGIARLDEAVAKQATASDARAVWAVVQAYAAPALGKRLPSTAEARALAYAAIIRGATGLVWRGEDSYAARSAGALGIGPLPPLDYGIALPETGRQPLRPTPDQVAQARGLWQSVSRLNREIERLTPALLSPDAAERLHLSVLPVGTPPDPQTPAPVLGMLKLHDHQYTLLMVNVTEASWRVRARIGRPMRRIERWFDDRPPPALQRGGTELTEEIPPFETRVFRLLP